MCKAVSLLQNRALIYNKDSGINSLKKKKIAHIPTHNDPFHFHHCLALCLVCVCVFLPRDHVQHSQTAARLYDLHVIEKPSAAR